MKKNKIYGWVFLDKPIGISSNAVLQKVRKIFGYCKAGYVGTLDPLASGFLPIALGDATKTIRYLENISKEYIFEVEWGVKTNTADIEGILEKTCEIYPSEEKIKNATKKLMGIYFQEPQKFSSKKINGIRAYKLARNNAKFKLSKKKVTIFDLKLTSVLSKKRSLFYVNCSSGTYVRSLAEDIAKINGTFATVTALKRIGFGDFNKKLISLDYLLSLVHSDELISVIKPLNLVFKNANEIILDENTIQHILNGRSIKMNHKKKVENRDFTLAKFKNEFIAIGYLRDNNFYPKKLLKV